jgi:chaperone required for assembly of F1-ATPase
VTGWSAKRFWKVVTVEAAPGGHAIQLDARPLATPAKRPLILPTRALADAVAAEWEAVEGVVDPRRMPFTRSANAAIDKVAPQFAEVAGLIADYGGSDLLCYRAEEPPALTARQAEAWDPLLDWAARRHCARLVVTRGIVPVAQAPQTLAALAKAVHATTPFELTALHDLVSLSGSLVIGLAATEPDSVAEALWRLSRVDEDWQAELWGIDDEAADAAETKRLAFLHAHRFWHLLRVG